MKCECIRCGGGGRDTSKWDVVKVEDRPGLRPRVFVQCRVCGSRWSSSSPDALEKAQAWQWSRGETPAEPVRAVVAVPAPTLFGGGLPSQSQGFVKVGSNLRGRSAQDVVNAIRRTGKDAAANDD